jgi:hypothetical protein
MMSGSESSASSTGTRNSSGHSLVICSMSSSVTSSRRGIEPSSAWNTERMEVGKCDSVLPKSHFTVYIKPSMIRMDEIVGQTPLKDLDQIQLVLTQMPAKALYQLQVSVDHEIQSRAHKNLVELQQATNKRETLETVCVQEKSENVGGEGMQK